ncbi:hypothetical protein FOL47_005830 [Perkinsus chesapeaki]|uniref:Peptidase A1 domain-containing protein n=1 Tax=Perkinsus chesapeaki TaxID=330153 RepID=A0A7J6LVS8_PERCH|nr:hypothetical protein FOL47_005830 [Perkinsus chesapeaki]
MNIALLLRSLYCLILVVRGQLSLLLADGKIGMNIDGNPLQLNVDTGSPHTLVVYKDWYEDTYGKGACKTLPSGCYSCPSKCDPYAKEVFVRSFNDGSEYSTVYLKGALSVNGKMVGDIEFGLVLNFTRGPISSDPFPHPMFGIGYDSIPGHYTVLHQLYARKLVPEFAYQICSPTPPFVFAGQLVLGSSQGACSIQRPITILPMVMLPTLSALSSAIFSYGLVSSKKHDAFVRPLDNLFILFDTGTESLAFPHYIFMDVKEKLINFASRDSGRTVNARVVNGLLCIGFPAIQYLPALTFSLGVKDKPFEVKILPKDYISRCDGQWCILRILYVGKHIILGRPFFSSYFLGADLENAKLKIANYQ